LSIIAGPVDTSMLVCKIHIMKEDLNQGNSEAGVIFTHHINPFRENFKELLRGVTQFETKIEISGEVKGRVELGMKLLVLASAREPLTLLAGDFEKYSGRQNIIKIDAPIYRLGIKLSLDRVHKMRFPGMICVLGLSETKKYMAVSGVEEGNIWNFDKWNTCLGAEPSQFLFLANEDNLKNLKVDFVPSFGE